MKFIGPCSKEEFYALYPPAKYYREIAEASRAIGLNVKDDDYEYIDDVLLSRLGLELLVRE